VTTPAFLRLRAAVAKSFPRATARDVEAALPNSDHIHLEQLGISTRIGVTDAERNQPQQLTVSLTMWPRRPFVDLGDDIRNTINYSEVCDQTKVFVRDRTDNLIETLADCLAVHLLRRFPIQRIIVDLRKFALPDAKFVAVRITRNAAVD
jgi:dihydroneopterin aldolase